MENKTRRMCFNLNGLTGGVIATLLLLGVLAFLTINAIRVQQENATKFYQLQDENNIQTKSVDNIKHRVMK
jgi:ABC-type phosphate transport system permease subunit